MFALLGVYSMLCWSHIYFVLKLPLLPILILNPSTVPTVTYSVYHPFSPPSSLCPLYLSLGSLSFFPLPARVLCPPLFLSSTFSGPNSLIALPPSLKFAGNASSGRQSDGRTDFIFFLECVAQTGSADS